MESPCECGIEPPGSISHGVRVSFSASFSLSYGDVGLQRNATIRYQRNMVLEDKLEERREANKLDHDPREAYINKYLIVWNVPK